MHFANHGCKEQITSNLEENINRNKVNLREDGVIVERTICEKIRDRTLNRNIHL